MKATFTLVLGLLAVGIIRAQEAPMLPANPFQEEVRRWQQVSEFYSRFLRAVGEPSILAPQKSIGKCIYRFTWSRSLLHTIAVFRLEVSKDGRGVLTLRLADPKADPFTYDVYREVTRTLTESQVVALTRDFMVGPYLELLPFLPSSMSDGEGWLLEANVDGYYRVTFRASPEEPVIQRIGRRFIDLFDEKDLQPKQGRPPNQALQHNDPSCHVSCFRTPRASRGRG